MHSDEVKRWIDLLERLSDPVLGRLDHQAQLSNALTKPHGLAGPLIAHCTCSVRRAAHVHKRVLEETASPTAPSRSRLVRDTDRTPTAPDVIANDPSGRLADVALWWGLFDSRIRVAALVDLDADGPLFDARIGRTFATIEVWTETELAGLHALWHHSHLVERYAETVRERMADRMTRTVLWHIENTQPDNATCHPWAVHVFLLHGTPESRHFAETQISNCLVTNAKPDVLSAWILMDAADAMSGRHG